MQAFTYLMTLKLSFGAGALCVAQWPGSEPDQRRGGVTHIRAAASADEGGAWQQIFQVLGGARPQH